MQLRLHAVFLLKSGTAMAVPAVPVAPPMSKYLDTLPASNKMNQVNINQMARVGSVKFKRAYKRLVR